MLQSYIKFYIIHSKDYNSHPQRQFPTERCNDFVKWKKLYLTVFEQFVFNKSLTIDMLIITCRLVSTHALHSNFVTCRFSLPHDLSSQLTTLNSWLRKPPSHQTFINGVLKVHWILQESYLAREKILGNSAIMDHGKCFFEIQNFIILRILTINL